jgi:GT2 family glycosyltransferase
MNPDIDVVIVAYGAPGLLDDCLATLGAGPAATVVDNSSDPEVRSVVEAHGAVYLDPGRNLGFGAGVNLALREHHRLAADVLLVNPDATIDPDAVDRLHRCLHEHPDRCCVAPAQVEPGSGESARVAWPFPTPGGAWLDALGLGGLRRGADFMIGSILLLNAQALIQIGRFDERFFLYAEETDWQRRAHDRGWSSVLCPEVTATHVGAGTGGDALERQTHFHASNERYIRKHYGAPGWWSFRAGVLLGAMVRALLASDQRQELAATRFRLYARGPLRAEAELPDPPPPTR